MFLRALLLDLKNFEKVGSIPSPLFFFFFGCEETKTPNIANWKSGALPPFPLYTLYFIALNEFDIQKMEVSQVVWI